MGSFIHEIENEEKKSNEIETIPVSKLQQYNGYRTGKQQGTRGWPLMEFELHARTFIKDDA